MIEHKELHTVTGERSPRGLDHSVDLARDRPIHSQHELVIRTDRQPLHVAEEADLGLSGLRAERFEDGAASADALADAHGLGADDGVFRLAHGASLICLLGGRISRRLLAIMTSKQSTGGRARAASLPADRRRLIASSAALARWGKARAAEGETFAYVIGPKLGPMKIGVAADLVSRRSALQVGNHDELEIHHATPVAAPIARHVEAYVHWLLADHVRGGEWFDVDAPTAEAATAQAKADVEAGKRAPERPKPAVKTRSVTRMIFDLTDDDRSALERLRVARGLRSHAETLRALIRGEGGEPPTATPQAPKPSFSHGRSKTVVVPPKRERAEAPAFKSRLKGEWKAP